MAGDRLRVKAAIFRIAIFRAARFAQDERRHRRIDAIIRNGFDDAEARPAMRAIGEGIAKTTLEGICDLLRTGAADCSVRRDLSMRGAADTFGNAEERRQIAGEYASERLARGIPIAASAPMTVKTWECVAIPFELPTAR